MKKVKKLYSIKHMLIVVAGVVIIGLVVLHVGGQLFGETAEAKQNAPVAQSLLPAVFKDSDTGLSLSIQLAQGQIDTGTFDFFIPDKGFYHGVMPLHQSGNHIVHPQGTVDAQFYPLNNDLPTMSRVKMEGEIDTNKNTSSINIWVNNVHYHLQTKQVDASSAATSAKKIAATFVADDWTSLYGQLSLDVKNTMTEPQFDEYMAINSSQNVISADLNGQGKITNVSGNTYDTQPISLTVRNSDGSTSIFHSNMFFVWENGSWKLLSTDTPKK